ncbi:hypothetical protein NSA56_01345 [Oceanobacillus caeni]|uniref:hypothetical protein n=1 Tax=Oceanobacillus caeni TaxID=405946 RepID=UPI002149C9E9|nr:hypothetical protein [Oceanobacillus caeni]MCR1833040.1 hypothetical protein [Oceanobacillus caeni]
MRKVMVKAWEIAKKGQNKFGGNVKEYFAEALKLAWVLIRKVRITTSAGSRNHKSWVAQITGKHPKFKLDRSFVNSVDHNMSERYFELVDGIYEICDAGSRQFIQIVKGNVEEIDYSDVMEMVA